MRGTTISVVPHDLDLAARYAGQLVGWRPAACTSRPSTPQVLTEENIRAGCRAVPAPGSPQ